MLTLRWGGRGLGVEITVQFYVAWMCEIRRTWWVISVFSVCEYRFRRCLFRTPGLPSLEVFGVGEMFWSKSYGELRALLEKWKGGGT